MRDFQDERYLEALGADLIMEDTVAKKTYVCTLDRRLFDSALTRGSLVFPTSALEPGSEVSMVVAATADSITVNDSDSTVYSRDADSDSEMAFAWRDADDNVVYTLTDTPVAARSVEQQNCWQIKCIEESVNGSNNETRIKYPNGSKRYEFAAADATTYSYEYGI